MLALGGSRVGTSVVVETADGENVQGTVLRDTDKEIVVRADYATLRLDKQQVKAVSGAGSSAEASPSGLLPSWRVCVDRLARDHGADLQQIPATVIDTGVMKNVPYLSHRAAGRELNVYGDPDRPAGIELGLVKEADKSESAKREVRELLRTMFTDSGHRILIDGLRLEVDRRERDGLVFEVTPPTEKDAYGGWWVSVYSVADLDGARASDAELSAITTARQGPVNSEKSTYSWSPEDVSLARVSPRDKEPGREIYVRGYFRKNGTYVQPYTRSAPGSGTKRR